jgi:hypothetical protein
METPQEKQPVRWQPDNVESGRSIRDNMDVEGVTLEWNTGREEEGRLPPPQNGTQETATATRPKMPKKLKIDKKDDTPAVLRRSTANTTGITSL